MLGLTKLYVEIIMMVMSMVFGNAQTEVENTTSIETVSTTEDAEALWDLLGPDIVEYTIGNDIDFDDTRVESYTDEDGNIELAITYYNDGCIAGAQGWVIDPDGKLVD